MHNKAHHNVKKQVPTEPLAVAAAIHFLKEHARAKFDETIEVHIHLAIDPKKSDQMVRGSAALPEGAPKQKRIAVLASRAEDQDAAKAAGADITGGTELIADIAATGRLDADIVIATPDLMPKIASVARILGPQGLMPNPKTGTVTPAPAQAVEGLRGGKLSFKMDQLGNIHEAVGKVSWEAERIVRNVQALLEAVRAAKPAAVRGNLIKAVYLKSTMSPALRLTKG